MVNWMGHEVLEDGLGAATAAIEGNGCGQADAFVTIGPKRFDQAGLGLGVPVAVFGAEEVRGADAGLGVGEHLVQLLVGVIGVGVPEHQVARLCLLRREIHHATASPFVPREGRLLPILWRKSRTQSNSYSTAPFRAQAGKQRSAQH